jgi:phosphoribosylformimino-5-aminoimidazole carboxamide ribotide isomerase
MLSKTANGVKASYWKNASLPPLRFAARARFVRILMGMKILPVIDLMYRRVVRGQGGRRDEYRPIQSRLTSSTDPMEVAQVFRRVFGLTEIYLADLDAILGGEPAFALHAELRRQGFRLWLDAGVRDPDDAQRLADAGIDTIVLGLETLREPLEFCQILRSLGPERVVFSLDLKEGMPLASSRNWCAYSALELARWIIYVGGRRLLLLDLARVGGYSGPGTEMLCAQLQDSDPGVEISVGGGIRHVDDLKQLKSLGVASVLIASALHDGRIVADDVKNL